MKLMVISGPDVGKSFECVPCEWHVLGRGRDAQFQVLDRHVSRSHCRFSYTGDQWLLEDMQSAGGTFVNGVRTEQATLTTGDVVRVGETQLQVENATVDDESTLVLPAAARPDPTPSPDLEDADELVYLIGETLGRFEVNKRLFEDAYGVVFEVTDQTTQRPAALRVIWPQFTKISQEMERFLQQYRQSEPITHPNIAREYAAGETSGYYWVASELVRGPSLALSVEAALANHPIPWQEALSLAKDIATGMVGAFERGSFHGCLRPAVIFLDQSTDTAKITEVHLFQAIQQTQAGRMIRPAQVMGEIAYMSPERTKDTEPVDIRSDVYSLGAMIYTLATGRNPFEANSLPEVITRIRTAEPIRPRKYAEAIPRAFESILLKTLAKKSQNRYQNPADLLQALESVS